MPNYAEYFERERYKPKYFLGDRVFGHYKKIPFIGTVGNDTVISEITGPQISIFLDLPMRVDGKVLSIIIVKHNMIKKLKKFNE